MGTSNRPPAIVLGGDTSIGLAIVRELGEHGVPVHVVARSKRGVALYSRWAKSRHIRPRDPDETVALLARVADTAGAEFLIAVAEDDAKLARRAADDGRLPGVRVLVPSLELLDRVNDKPATYAAARDAGIPVPRTWQPADGAAPPPLPGDVTYPCIVKWREPGLVADALRQAGLSLVKAEYCYDAAELGLVLERYRPLERYPMVQQFCRGVGLGHMLFMVEGRALLRFQHVRLGEWPPEGGTSTVCRSLPPDFHEEWLDLSEELLKRIGWEGAAMVEYRFDAATGTRWLMEINGRFWGSQPLAYHAGASFGWLTYAVLGLGERPPVAPYRPGITCRYMVPETRRVLTLVFRRGAVQDRDFVLRPLRAVVAYFIAFVRPSTRYYVFTWRDPKPFFVDMGFVILKALGLVRR